MEIFALLSTFVSIVAGIVFFILLIMIYLKLDTIADLLKKQILRK